MKFDLAFIADEQPIAEAKNLSFVALLTLLIAFPRKKFKHVTFTIQTSDDEVQE